MSRDLPKCPFTLPAEPVDRYEVRWWEVDTLILARPIVAHRAVYIVKASWEETGRGAPFVNNWQHFRNEHFTGRNVGWTSVAEPGEHWWRAHATYEAARAHAIELLKERQTRLVEELNQTTDALTKLVVEAKS
jgi:hypothetical protein